MYEQILEENPNNRMNLNEVIAYLTKIDNNCDEHANQKSEVYNQIYL